MLSLTDSLQLRHLKISNRNVHSAMTRNRATGNVPNHYNVEYYTQRVRGGAGLIVTEGTLVTQQGYVSSFCRSVSCPVVQFYFFFGKLLELPNFSPELNGLTHLASGIQSKLPLGGKWLNRYTMLGVSYSVRFVRLLFFFFSVIRSFVTSLYSSCGTVRIFAPISLQSGVIVDMPLSWSIKSPGYAGTNLIWRG
jgi:hypothetical protein